MLSARWLLTLIFLGFTLSGFTQEAPPQELKLQASLQQEVYLVNAQIPLSLQLTFPQRAPTPSRVVVYANSHSLGTQGCFKVSCRTPEGTELPVRLPAAREELLNVKEAGPSWRGSIDLLNWFRPPIGGPYTVTVYYEWTEEVPKYAPHFLGRSTVAEVRFSVRGVDYAALSAQERETVDRALEELTGSKTQAARDALKVLGPRVLPALHDALQMANMNRRAALMEIVADIGDPASIPCLLAVPISYGMAISLNLRSTKERCVARYGADAVPFIIDRLKQGAATGPGGYEGILVRIGQPAVAPLLAAMQEKNLPYEFNLVTAGARVLAHLKEKTALPILEQLKAEKPQCADQLQQAIDAINKAEEASNTPK